MRIASEKTSPSCRRALSVRFFTRSGICRQFLTPPVDTLLIASFTHFRGSVGVCGWLWLPLSGGGRYGARDRNFDLVSDFRNTLADGTSRGNLAVFRYTIVKKETRKSGHTAKN